MNNLTFRVQPFQGIHVGLNDKFLFIQTWHDDMSLEGNILAAVKAAKRLLDEMAEQGKRAGEAGQELKKKCRG